MMEVGFADMSASSAIATRAAARFTMQADEEPDAGLKRLSNLGRHRTGWSVAKWYCKSSCFEPS
jgi:hypothetical protein